MIYAFYATDCLVTRFSPLQTLEPESLGSGYPIIYFGLVIGSHNPPSPGPRSSGVARGLMRLGAQYPSPQSQSQSQSSGGRLAAAQKYSKISRSRIIHSNFQTFLFPPHRWPAQRAFFSSFKVPMFVAFLDYPTNNLPFPRKPLASEFIQALRSTTPYSSWGLQQMRLARPLWACR